MRRDTGRLTTTFDVLVIGGGIYGLMAAWEAALRGLSVALIERDDFGAGTSFNSARTIHGGVRSLQRLAFAEMLEYVDERRILTTIAPHLIHPLPFLMPATASASANPLTLRAYFAVYSRMTSRRSQPSDPSKALTPPRFVGREEMLMLNPLIEPRGVLGGMQWTDCQMHSSERLAIALVQSAHERGAVLCNYVEAKSLRQRNHHVVGATAYDRVAGETIDIEATAVINAAGPQASTLAPPGRTTHPALVPALAKSMNLVIASRTGECALASSARGRLFFLAPWRGFTIAGTSHDDFPGAPTDDVAAPGDVTPLLEDVNRAFPRLNLHESHVHLVHRGLLPARVGPGGGLALLRHSLIHDHSVDGSPGLFSIVGVRYTTARATACAALDVISPRLSVNTSPSSSALTPLHGGGITHYAAFERDTVKALTEWVSEVVALRLVRHYGTAVRCLQEHFERDPESRRPLDARSAILIAELQHVSQHEMVVTLEDVLLRRLDALQFGDLDDAALDAAAQVVGRILEWSPARRSSEVSSLKRTVARMRVTKASGPGVETLRPPQGALPPSARTP